MYKYKNYLHLNFANAVNMLENGSIQNIHNFMLHVQIGFAFGAALNQQIQPRKHSSNALKYSLAGYGRPEQIEVNVNVRLEC